MAFACTLAKKYGASVESVGSGTDLEGRTDSECLEFRESVWKLLPEYSANEFPLHIVSLREPKAKTLTEAVFTRSADLVVIGGENREWLTLHEEHSRSFSRMLRAQSSHFRHGDLETPDAGKCKTPPEVSTFLIAIALWRSSRDTCRRTF